MAGSAGHTGTRQRSRPPTLLIGHPEQALAKEWRELPVTDKPANNRLPS
jgi:hypothetical protein